MFEDRRTIQNNDTTAKIVWLEPWASDFTLEPGASVVIVGRSPHAGIFEVVDYGDKFGVYGWPGSDYEVFQGGELIGADSAFSDDGPPSAQTFRQLIEGMFGGPGGTGD